MSVAVPASLLCAREPLGLRDGDQRLRLSGVDWKTYLLLNDAIDQPSVRMAYCDLLSRKRALGPRAGREIEDAKFDVEPTS